jgi:hypothetical protein
MLIRMMFIGTHITALLAAGVVATGSLVGAGFAASSDDQSRPTALVIDASLARDGRELVDPRLKDLDAEIRLPRNATEARTNVRYFDALDYRVYVAGSHATAAAEATGVDATDTGGLDGALAVAR